MNVLGNIESVDMNCPVCSSQLNVKIETVVDFGEDLSFKDRFQRGEVNAFRCRNCGEEGALGFPIAIHAPVSQKVLFFIPNVLRASRKERKGLEANMRAAVREAYGRKAPPYFDKPIVIRDPRRLMKALDETRVGSAHSSASAIKRWFGGR